MNMMKHYVAPREDEEYDAPAQVGGFVVGQRIEYSGEDGDKDKGYCQGIVDFISTEPDSFGDYIGVRWDDGVEQRVHLPLAKEFCLI